jgi:hypothetical protein
MDASKGGEAAYNTWMATQTEQMYAARLSGNGTAGNESVNVPGPTPGAADTDVAASEGGAPTADGASLAQLAASLHVTASAAGEMSARNLPLGNGAVPAGGVGSSGGRPLTLSQLAAWNVGDVLLRAGPRSPQAGCAWPRGPFGRRHHE